MNTERAGSANCSEGILLVSDQGIIKSLNVQAEGILSVSRDQAIGHPIVDVLDGRVPDATFTDLISKFHYEPTKTGTRNLASTKNPLSVRCEALQGDDGHSSWLVTLSTSRSRSSPVSANAMRHFLNGSSKKTFFSTGIVLVVVIAIYGLHASGSHADAALPFTESVASMPTKPNEVGSTPKTLDAALSLVGTIEAGNTISVTAPFDATIKEKGFAFDSEVSQGQLLLRLDTTELLNRIQESKVAMLKTAKALHELETWEKGAEVARAQRNSILARQQVEQSERKVQEADNLLRKGIIPRSEYDGLVEQLSSHNSQLAASLDDLRATREKANRSNLEIARIEFMQAQAKYKELSDGLALEKISALRAGIITKVPITSGQAAATLEVGSRITKGQLLFNIASTDKFTVSAKVDEADIVDLTSGAKVSISMDSQDMLPIEGRLVEISAQAEPNGGISRSAVFDIKIELPELDVQQRSRLRVGMSCNVSIDKTPKVITAKSPTNSNPIQ